MSKLIVGNWKMNCLAEDGTALARGLAEKVKQSSKPSDLALCPPAPLIPLIVEATKKQCRFCRRAGLPLGGFRSSYGRRQCLSVS